MPNAPAPDRATAIRAATDTARSMSSTIPADFADKAIASGKSLDDVKAELFDLTQADGRARMKANMQALVAGMKGEAGEPPTATIAASRESMARELRKMGLAPKGA